MPVYCYRCPDCKAEFESRHSMNYNSQPCIECNSERVFRIPSLSDSKITVKSSKPGKVVNDYIREVKQEIKQEKKDLRSREL